MVSTTGGAAGAVLLGKWVYTPAPAAAVNATLHDSYRRVDLRHSAQLLEDLLTELGHIQARFAASASNPEGCDTHFLDEPHQQSHHV
ncbi:hypothetical protein ACFWBH_20185 [Streptomyces sp. NPDC059999]|uniref:hypothetical protein n=1 Tax=Streptomyces sp. NPDC059999 TaxID=3347030 RepID=UPI00367DF55F